MSACVNREDEPEIRLLDDEQAKLVFENTVKSYFNISGDEFLRRFRAGEFKKTCDNPNLLQVISLIPQSLR